VKHAASRERQALPLVSEQPTQFRPLRSARRRERTSGNNEMLSAAIKAHRARGIHLTDEQVLRLYKAYAEANGSRALERLGQTLDQILQDIVLSARSVGADVSRFTSALEQHGHELDRPCEQIVIRAIVSALIGDTQQMRTLTSALMERMTASAQEAQELRLRLRQTQAEALFDGLTGLRNRRGFEQDVLALREERGSLEGCALLFADVDHFKRINDGYGHLFGDKVLCAVGEVIRANTKGRDIAARLGGEEFVVLLPATTPQGARALAEQLCQAIAKDRIRRTESEVIGNVTISIGIAHANAHDTLETLIGRADAGMYAAKKAGRNRVHSAADR